ncbi:MAG: hypothetical protein V4850_16590 [Myxococcota bacterium]
MPARGALALLVLAACGGDTTITRRNDAPLATIMAPSSGTEVVDGATVVFAGTVFDADDAAGDLVARWLSGSDELCAAAPVAEDGTTACEVELGRGDEEIVLEGRDPDNAVGIASVDLVILASGAPDVELLAPDGVGPYYADHEVAFAAVVGDAEDDATALSVRWVDPDGAVLDIDATPDADGALAGAWAFDTGGHAVTLTVTDTTGKTASTTIAFQVGGANVPPGCSITAPVDGLQVGQGIDVAFTGTVLDPDVTEDRLAATWSSDLDGVLAAGNADVDGNVAFTTATLTGGQHTITLTGTDEVGATCADSIVVEVSAPPTVDIDLPVDGDVYNDGAAAAFSATVADDSTASDALLLTWESDLDGVLDTTPADGAGVAGFDAAWLSVGTHTVTLTVTDEAGLSTSASAWFVVNGLPTAPTVAIDPVAAGGNDDLTATVSGAAVDPEGDPITYTYAWYVDGAATAYTGDTVPASATTRGEVWEVYVTPNDGYGDGASGTASVTIDNSAPTLADVSLTPDPAYETDTLTCTPGVAADTDGDAITYTYAWSVDGVTLADTSTTLDASAWERGDRVVCTVTPTDGTDAGAAVDSAALTISNSVPSLADIAITPASPEAGDTLTCTATGFADADGDGDQSVYEWTVEGAYAGSGPTLAGGFLGGDEVICAVTPYDGLDYGEVLSDAVTIENAAPVLAGVTLSPASPTEADLLVCTPGLTTDLDGTTSFSYTYGWTVDGVVLAATTSTLDSSAFAKRDVVTCDATPNDGTDDGVTVASNPVTAINTPPEVLSATLSPTSPDTDASLTATVSAADLDGDGVSLRYAWYVNGMFVGSGDTLDGAASFENGDSVYLVVTPNDGDEDGAPHRSDAVVIANTLPVIATVTLTPSPAYEETTLTCAPTATDADGDPITYTYGWTVDGAAVSATGATLTGADFDKEAAVVCSATPNDGSGSGAVSNSNVVTISNTAPVMTSVALTPASASESSTLTCTPAATDADSDAVSYAYAWYVNGAANARTTSTLTGTYFDGGDSVYCRVTPTDGTTAGTALASDTVTIGNTAPVLSAVVLTPASATVASTLTCTPTASDADGDTISYGYAWYVNSAAIAATSATLTATSFDAGDTVYCRVTPNDGTTAGTASNSNTVTIDNTAPVISAVTLTPTTAYEANTLTCTPTATDVDGDAITYTYAWSVNAASIASTSSTLTGAYFDRDDAVLCRVTPNDGTVSGTASNSNTVTISNTAPVVSSVSLTPTSADEASTLTCTPTATDADSDAVTYTYAWYVNGTANARTTSTLTGTYFDGGDTVYCRVTPTDGTTAGTASNSNTVTIGNTAPVLSAVVLTPASPTVASTLTCTPTATDADGDTISYGYAWYVNSAAIAATSATLTATSFDAGDTVYCRVTPNDGTTAGTASNSNTVTIDNTAPVISAVTLTPTTAYEANTLTCTPTATDVDGDAITYTYAWSVNAASIASTSSTLTGAYFDRDDAVLCRVTPNDGTVSGTASNSNTVTISNTAPVVSSVSLTPTSADEASTLTCTPTATDADSDAVTYTYAWYVNGTANARTTSTLTGTYFDGGDTVYCRVTPTDGTTAGTASNSNTVTIGNTAPVLSAVVLTPASPTVASTLTCTPTATDADGDTISYGYAWYVNSAAIAATSATLTATSFDAGDTVYCRVTPNDGTTAGTASNSNTVTIDNTAPVISAVTLTPTTAYEANTLTCTPTATDADGDAITYTYAWYVNSALIAPTSTTLSGTYFSKANTVYCRVTPNDGTTAGTASNSNTVTISNTAPVVSSVSLTPTTAYEASTLTCSPAATDADGDAITYTYAWYVNSALIAPTTSTLTGTYFSRTNTVYCRVTPNDGTTAGTASTSNTVTISNTAPVISAVSLTPTTAYETSTLTCTPTATDADGGSITYTYAWVVGGSTIAPTSSTLTGTYFNRGNAVYCRATPSDGVTSGSAVASNTVTIANSLPGAPVLAISPTAPMAGVDDLFCDVVTDSSDADGDGVDYDISWTVDGAAYPGVFTGTTGPTTTNWLDDTIPAADTHFGITWQCTAIPFDAGGDGPSAIASVDVDPASCSGTAPGPVCSGETVSVAYLPGWSSTHTSSASLIWSNLETNSLLYGDCTIDITSVGSSFTLATLSAYDAIIVSDPSGGSRLYTSAEQTAIRDYLEGGYGGAYASFLLKYLTFDNSPLMDLFGIDPTGMGDGSSPTSGTASVVDASHPVADGLPASFSLLGYGQEQVNAGGWTAADLGTCAEFVMYGAGQSAVIANDDYNWRSVYFTGMPEYNNAGTDSRQAIYNALLWAAGYQ